MKQEDLAEKIENKNTYKFQDWISKLTLMIEICKARKILGKIDAKYGHTEPWVILCEGQSGWEEFIVKIFSEAHLTDKPRVHGEFLGSWLCGEFDLMTPDFLRTFMSSWES